MDFKLPYEDVRAAWRHYLAHDNGGRGVVLIGHSQGARILARLIAHEIEGKPEQRLLAGALILGFDVEVPEGKDVGGTFKTIPLCRSARTGRLRRRLRDLFGKLAPAEQFPLHPSRNARHGDRLHRSRRAFRR